MDVLSQVDWNLNPHSLWLTYLTALRKDAFADHLPCSSGSGCLWGFYKISNVWKKKTIEYAGLYEGWFPSLWPVTVPQNNHLHLINSWTFVSSSPRPAISGPTSQIIIESENSNPWSTEYWMIILWAYNPSLRKTDAYLSQRVVCI